MFNFVLAQNDSKRDFTNSQGFRIPIVSVRLSFDVSMSERGVAILNEVHRNKAFWIFSVIVFFFSYNARGSSIFIKQTALRALAHISLLSETWTKHLATCISVFSSVKTLDEFTVLPAINAELRMNHLDLATSYWLPHPTSPPTFVFLNLCSPTSPFLRKTTLCSGTSATSWLHWH